MNITKRVAVRFGADTYERDVTLGALATDAYYIETARQELTTERDGLGRFRGGRVTGEVPA